MKDGLCFCPTSPAALPKEDLGGLHRRLLLHCGLWLHRECASFAFTARSHGPFVLIDSHFPSTPDEKLWVYKTSDSLNSLLIRNAQCERFYWCVMVGSFPTPSSHMICRICLIKECIYTLKYTVLLRGHGSV